MHAEQPRGYGKGFIAALVDQSPGAARPRALTGCNVEEAQPLQ